MIRSAAQKLSESGVRGASFSNVLELSGASRGAIYHHFPGGKDELIEEAITYVGESAMAQLQKSAGLPATEVVSQYSRMWRRVLVGGEFKGGCAVAAVVTDAESEHLVHVAASIFRSWRSLLGQLLIDGGVAPQDAPVVAATVVATLEGAMLLARAEGDIDVFDQVSRHLIKSLA